MLPTDTGRRDVQTDPLDIPSPEGSPSSMRPPRSLGGRESVAQQLRRVSYAAIGKTNDACGAPRGRGDSRASSERRVQALEKKMHERDLQWVRRCEAQTAEIRRLHEEAQVARLQADEEVRAVRDWYRRAQYSQSRPDLTIRSLQEELAHSLASNAQLSHHIQTLELQLLVQVNAMKAALPPQQLVVRYYCPDGGGGGGSGGGGGDATATPTSVPYYARYSPVDLMEGTYKPPGGGRGDASASGRHRQASPTPPPPAAAPQPPPAPLSAADADGPDAAAAAAAAAVPATPPGLGTSSTSASTRGSGGGGSCGSSAAAEDSDPGYGGAAVDAEAAGGSVVARVGCPVRFFSAAPPRGAPKGLFSPPAPEIEDASSATEAAEAAAQASVAEKYANPYYRAASDGAAPPPHLAELAQRVPQLSDLSRALLDDGRVGDAAERSLAEQASTWQARLRSLVTTGGSGSGGTTTTPPPPLPPSQKRPSSSERQRLLPILSPPQQCKTSGYSRHSGVFRELDDCRNNADTFQAAAAAAAGGAHHHNHNHHRNPSPPPRASGSGGGGGGGGGRSGVVRSLSPNGVRVPAATPAPAPSGEGGSGSGVYGGEHAPHSLSRPSAPQPPQPREGSARAPPRDAGVRLPLLPRLPSASGGGGGGGGARGCGRKKKGCAATVVSQALLGQRKLREQNKVLRGLAGFGAFASSGGRPSSPLRGLAAAVKRATVVEEVRGFDTQTFSAGVYGGRGAE